MTNYHKISQYIMILIINIIIVKCEVISKKIEEGKYNVTDKKGLRAKCPIIELDDIEYEKEGEYYKAKGKVTFDGDCKSYQGDSLYCFFSEHVPEADEEYYMDRFSINCKGTEISLISVDTREHCNYFNCQMECGYSGVISTVSVNKGIQTYEVIIVIFVVFAILACFVGYCACYYKKKNNMAI